MKAKRTSLPQRQSATNPRQASNTTEVRIRSSIPQKGNREMTYARAVANLSEQHNVQENEDVKQTLQLILDKLNKQEALFTTFDERIKKLEHSAQGATPKIRQKWIVLLKLWHGMPVASYNINKNCRQSLIQKKWMCVSYLKHTLLSNHPSSLGAIKYIIPSALKILLGEEALS